MSTTIADDYTSLEIDGRVIATAERRDHAAANDHGEWIVSSHPSRLFTRNQAVTAMMVAERLAFGYGDDDRSRSAGATSWERDKSPLPASKQALVCVSAARVCCL